MTQSNQKSGIVRSFDKAHEIAHNWYVRLYVYWITFWCMLFGDKHQIPFLESMAFGLLAAWLLYVMTVKIGLKHSRKIVRWKATLHELSFGVAAYVMAASPFFFRHIDKFNIVDIIAFVALGGVWALYGYFHYVVYKFSKMKFADTT